MADALSCRPRLKEIFMSNCQQYTRLCTNLHFMYVAEPLSQFKRVSARTVVHYIATRLDIRRGLNVHIATDDRIVLSFCNHRESSRAWRLTETNLRINGCAYRFFSSDAPIHLRSISSDQRVSITLKNLPLHMWTAAITEQVLSPYCALEYVDQETRCMDDPSGYTCIVRSQKLIRIPDAIAIKVPDSSIAEGSDSSRTAASLFLNKYTVIVEKAQYLHGITRRYRYACAPSLSTSRVVQPAECYISPVLLDSNAIRKYSSAVILQPEPYSYMADLEHVCEFLESNMHIQIQVKLLNDNEFLLYIDQEYPFMTLHKILSVSMEEWILKGDLKLIQWTPEYGSVGCVVTKVAQLQITGLPCNLCSAPVIEYILGPFGSVKFHETNKDDSEKNIGRTISTYRCTLWCVGLEVIPASLQIKMLPARQANLAEISTGISCNCPILDVLIRASAVPSIEHFV